MAKEDKDKKEEKNERINAGIVPVDIVSEMKDSYLDYAMSVIVGRALPDVRDGLKPVHRRILYVMHEIGLTSSARFKKSAAIVGDVLAKYHPHGDTAVYDAMVKLAQDFSTRYPLVWGQGNFGSIDGDSAAAYRYTEAKMTKLSGELLRDIEKETVDFIPNYDGERKEPLVLPAVVPNLLLNGTLGIAVGMATKVPPHNLAEVLDALLHLIQNRDATTDDLTQFVTGPDFPTGGVIFNKKDIAHAYNTGRGGIVLRGVAEIVDEKGGNQIVITSIPYQVNKADMIVKMADLVRDKKIEGIKDIRDESTTLENLRVTIDLKGTAHPQKILNSLYKHTDLETMFHFNMLALVDGVPQLLSLKGILDEFLKHRQDVVTRRAKFELKKAEAREHILVGLKKALDHIDEIIKLIKKSKDTPEAHKNLMSKFKFSTIQATAILEMKLQKLAGLERKKIEDELKAIQALIAELKELLASPKKIMSVIANEFTEIKEKYSDDRRTKVMAGGVKEIKPEDLIPEAESVLVLTSGGYIKRTNPSEYRAQKRGGVGVMDLNVKEEDFVTLFLTANTHDDLLFFTDRGKAYQIKMYDVPEGKRATKGKSVMNFLSLDGNENVTSVLSLSKESKSIKDLYLMMITKQGVAKKVDAASFHDVRRSGIISIKLAAGDELLSACLVGKGDSVIMSTKDGQSIRFAESDIRKMGRTAAGVRAMKLKKGDVVVGAGAVRVGNDGFYLVMGENGYGKKTPLNDYKIQGRGGSGIKTMNVTTKTGTVMSAKVLGDEEEEMVAISKHGQTIRTKLSEIPALGRQTQGVRIMKLRTGDSIASLTCL